MPTPHKRPTLPNLPLHLGLAMSSWLASPLAWQRLSTESPRSKAKNARPGAELNLTQALSEEAQSRANNLLTGLSRYLETPYARVASEPPCIWQSGSARLLDYGSGTIGKRAIALFVPSLINRYYILDLEAERSMMRWLAAQGLHPVVLDWGTPTDAEKDYGCDDYAIHVLGNAVKQLSKLASERITLVGYCMGGVLSLAVASLLRRHLNGLALLATPWDFHCPEFKPFILEPDTLPYLRNLIQSQKQLPAQIIQALFYLTDPWIFEQKFRRYAELAPESRAARDFVALEHWVNDGVPMTANVAHDCLIGWAQENRLMRRKWEIGGRIIAPERLRIPTFIAIPRNDHVVPADCAWPLAKALPHAQIVQPGAGHVGMIVGTRAKRELWQPLLEWILNLYNC